MNRKIVKSVQIAVALMFLLSAMPPMANAQSITGQISGSVTDPSGAVIPGAVVQLTSDLTRQVRAFTTDSNGAFVFTNLVPGDYSVHIERPGFKAYEQRAISVSAQEHVDLHEIRLPVGDVSTTVDVPAQVAHVATDSSDRSILVDRTMIENTPILSRSYMEIINALPGLQATASADLRGNNANSPAPTGGVNGGASGSFLVTLDGIVNKDVGGNSTIYQVAAPSIDAIAEVKVTVSNYSAEYGSRAGGQMNVTMKNGTNQFHGTAYYYWRHEDLNANAWFNNRTGVARPIYRYQNPGGTIGGPVIIPGTSFNKSRTKLFFFFSEDYLRHSSTSGVNQFTMPTALERSGDFSKTTTTTVVLIPIKDPTTGKPLPGNVIPASKISPIGAALLNLFPLPNTTDPTGRRQYNFQSQYPRLQTVEDRLLRVDYNITPKTTAFVRPEFGYEGDNGGGSQLSNPGATWGQTTTGYHIHIQGLAATVIHIFRPNLVNEFTWGFNRFPQRLEMLDQAEYANDLLPALKTPGGQAVTLPHFFPGNTMNLDPNISFASSGAQSAGQAVTKPPAFGWDSRFPYTGSVLVNNVIDNLTWIKGGHNMKFGFYLERGDKDVSVYSIYSAAGQYCFGSDTANPNDTGYPYSNALVGTVQAYGEDNQKLICHSRYTQVEWFVQDSWKATRRLSLDLGMRFQVIGPTYADGATLGFFSAAAYNPSQSGQLLYPALVNGQKVAIDPKTGATYPSTRATSFDPASYPAGGNPYSGIVQYHDRFFKTRLPQLGPRVGFAYDIFGDGKTALRGGFGIFYDRSTDSTTIGALSGTSGGPMMAPPAFHSPVFYNTTFSDLLNTQGWVGPQNVVSARSESENPNVVQLELRYPARSRSQHGSRCRLCREHRAPSSRTGARFDPDVASTINANAIAPLTTWTPAGGPKGTANPKYLDPTSAGGTGAFYATTLIQAMTGYQGYGTISVLNTSGENYYNSLQVQVNRRFTRRLQFNANWTWSKLLTYARQQWIPDQLTKNVLNRPQAANITFGYLLPDGSRIWRNALTKGALDGWHLNGFARFFAGTPMTIDCTAQSAPIGWPNGTPTGGIPLRCEMQGSLWLPAGTAPPKGDSQLWYRFNAASFALPPGSTLGLGNTPPTLTYGPGFENIDLSVSKVFRIKESRSLEFRAEAFNALNHFNPSNPNTSLTLNFNTGANTNANFGYITTAQNLARRVALSLRFRF